MPDVTYQPRRPVRRQLHASVRRPLESQIESAAAMSYRTPLMLMSLISSQSSTRRSSRGETGMMPALLTRTPSLPYRSHAYFTGLDKSSPVLRPCVHRPPLHPLSL